MAMVVAVAKRPTGVQGLVFIVYVYDDHSIASVTRRDYDPVRGMDLRLGRIRLSVGRHQLHGLSVQAALHLVGKHLAEATDSPTAPAVSAPPEGVTGAAVRQLRNVALPGM